MLPKGYLMGNMTNDPTVGSSSTWNYARFSVACNSFEVPEGEQTRKSVAHFFECIAWGKTAEYIGKNIKKGDRVLLDFVLSTNNYNNSEGKTVKNIEFRVLSIEVVYKRNKDNNLSEDFQDSNNKGSLNDNVNSDSDDEITLDDIFAE